MRRTAVFTLREGAGGGIVQHAGHQCQNVGILALPHIKDRKTDLRNSSQRAAYHPDHGAGGGILGSRLRDQIVHQRRVQHRLDVKTPDQRRSRMGEPPVLGRYLSDGNLSKGDGPDQKTGNDVQASA